MKKLMTTSLFSLFFSASALAGNANIMFDQHFKVKNKTGEKITVNILKGRYDDREKKIGSNKSEKYKFNNLKEEVKRGCGPNTACGNVSFDRTFILTVTGHTSGNKRQCSFTMDYYSTKHREKVKSRSLGSDSCRGDFSTSGEDGKTMNIEIKGFAL